MSKVWLIASGKGGVGKSTLAACLGIAMTQLGYKSCIVDADIGLRDQDAILGQENRIVYDIVDVCNKSCRLQQSLIQHEQYPDLYLLPASQFARCKELKPTAFASLIDKLRNMHDVVLIDCPAGIEKGLRNTFKAHIDECIIVTTPDDVCMRNAERLMQVLKTEDLPRPRLVVNRLQEDLIQSHEMYAAAVVAQSLDAELLGEIPEDRCVYRALLNHHTPMAYKCDASAAIKRISSRLSGSSVPLPSFGSQPLPWYKRILKRSPKPLSIKEVKPL